ncbi:predicted protein [Histoplasma capsulatum H143]|uniref:Uncharacterized protein n=1 Tax=Ajellomyces capsulatus (strain H143) TaxID=544712 RepID=C6H1J2_AJECH|nr:predicted protein [Histoplasma capsulatum H143]
MTRPMHSNSRSSEQSESGCKENARVPLLGRPMEHCASVESRLGVPGAPLAVPFARIKSEVGNPRIDYGANSGTGQITCKKEAWNGTSFIPQALTHTFAWKLCLVAPKGARPNG